MNQYWGTRNDGLWTHLIFFLFNDYLNFPVKNAFIQSDFAHLCSEIYKFSLIYIVYITPVSIAVP